MNFSLPPARLQRMATSPMLRLNVLAALTGAAVACLAWLFLQMIDGVQWLFYRDGGFLEHNYGVWIMLVPAAGGLATGLIIKYYAAEARGHGVPVVMEAVAVNRARLGTRIALSKGVAAAICIGTGFSLGRIGPLILMASTFGSEVGQRMGMSVEETRTMVGCGAAAALTTAFNAPLGGVIFAIELIVTEFRTRSFIPLVVATVIATAVARAIKGDISAFDSLPPYSLNSPLEYLLYLVLGLLAGLAATGFIKLLFGFDRLMTAMHQLPLPAQTTLGGLTVGAIALAFPEILGNGFDITHGMLQGTAVTARLRGPGGLLTIDNMALLLAALFVLKLIATSISIGSGGSGGVFTPSLFLGAALGATFGLAVAPLGFTAPAGAYALVGMAAFTAAATRGTLTAIVLLFEMTGDYQIILPLMLACVVADAVCYVISEHSIYTTKLAQRGVHIDLGAEQDLMRMLTIEEAMSRDVMTLAPDTPLEVAISRLEDTGHMSFPVLEEGKLVGIITWADLHNAVVNRDRHLTVGDYCVREVLTVTPDDPLTRALDLLGQKEIGHLPVVDPHDSTRLVGLITKGDIIKAYNQRRLVRRKLSWDQNGESL